MRKECRARAAIHLVRASGAALLLESVTAWNAMVAKAKLKSGRSVFLIRCLGGVGRSAVQIALMQGANVVGNCSTPGREDALAVGVREVVDDRAFDIAQNRHRFDVVCERRARCR